MTEEEFIQEEDEFLDTLRNSAIYKKTKELSDQIDKDPRLNDLATRRDDFYERSTYVSGEEQEKLIAEFKRLDDEFRSDPVVAEYIAYYQEMRRVLGHLSNLFTKELRKV
jgi:cell fate (sporulation/competence/biofilm development) regulator YlbF (YheA/YmcA/DUF963 family)